MNIDCRLYKRAQSTQPTTTHHDDDSCSRIEIILKGVRHDNGNFFFYRSELNALNASVCLVSLIGREEFATAFYNIFFPLCLRSTWPMMRTVPLDIPRT